MAMVCRPLLLIAFFLLGTFGAPRENFGRLQRNVNFLLQSVVDIKKDIFDLYEAVNNLQNISQFETAATVEKLSISKGKKIADIPKSSVSISELTDKIESNMNVIKRGFNDEKEILRQQFNLQATTVDGFMKQMQSNISHHRYTLKKAETRMRTKIQETGGIIDEIRSTMDNKTYHITQYVEEMRNEMIQALNDTSLEMKMLSTRIDAIESDISNIKEDQDKVIGIAGKVASLSNLFKLPNIKGYIKHGESLYKFFDDVITWKKARKRCTANDGYLVEIKDDEEIGFLKTLVEERYIWNGATDLGHEGEWRWDVSGEAVDGSLWAKGEPNNAGGREHCGQSNGLRFNDVPCDFEFAFVCEFTVEHLFYKRIFQNF